MMTHKVMTLVLTAAAVLSLLGAVVLDFAYRFVNTGYVDRVRIDSGIDQVMRSVGKRDIYLYLDHLDSLRQIRVGAVYFRGNYAVYPRRILAADPSRPIGSYKDILLYNAPRDDDWLRSHDIDAEVTLQAPNNSEGFATVTREIPAAQP